MTNNLKKCFNTEFIVDEKDMIIICSYSITFPKKISYDTSCDEIHNSFITVCDIWKYSQNQRLIIGK